MFNAWLATARRLTLLPAWTVVQYKLSESINVSTIVGIQALAKIEWAAVAIRLFINDLLVGEMGNTRHYRGFYCFRCLYQRRTL